MPSINKKEMMVSMLKNHQAFLTKHNTYTLVEISKSKDGSKPASMLNIKANEDIK